MKRSQLRIVQAVLAVVLLSCGHGTRSVGSGDGGSMVADGTAPPGSESGSGDTRAAVGQTPDATAETAGILAGVAVVDVTPKWATHVIVAPDSVTSAHYHNVDVRALAISDQKTTVVFVTADVGVFCNEVSDQIYSLAKQQLGLEPEHLVLNASHTHSGPAICTLDDVVDPSQMDYKYQASFVQGAFQAIKKAVAALGPAVIGTSESTCDICINRDGPPYHIGDITPNPDGPIDRRVRLLVVRDPKDDRLRAVLSLFGCHTSDVETGPSFGADFFGWARDDVEKRYPGAVALTAQGTAGDVRVAHYYDGDIKKGFTGTKVTDLAPNKELGRKLGVAIVEALGKVPTPVRGPIRAGRTQVSLPLQEPYSREEATVAAMGKDPIWSNSAWRLRWSKHMLALWEKADMGIPIPRKSDPYAIRVMHFGDDFSAVGLDGEVFTCVGQNVEKALARPRTMVFGYSNDIAWYVPCKANFLPPQNGGNYGVNISWWWNQPALLDPTVDMVISDAAAALSQEMLQQ